LRGLIVGRWQPPHKGHVKAIRWILERVNELIIVIGSADQSYTYENPFTAGERFEMIDGALKQEGVSRDRYIIVPVPDIKYNSVWVKHIENYVPEFDIVYSGNKLVCELFRDEGYKVKEQKMYEREKLEGTRIRKMMLENKNWEELLPEYVVSYIKKIDGAGRIRRIEGLYE